MRILLLDQVSASDVQELWVAGWEIESVYEPNAAYDVCVAPAEGSFTSVTAQIFQYVIENSYAAICEAGSNLLSSAQLALLEAW